MIFTRIEQSKEAFQTKEVALTEIPHEIIKLNRETLPAKTLNLVYAKLSALIRQPDIRLPHTENVTAETLTDTLNDTPISITLHDLHLMEISLGDDLYLID